ncbi:MAG TPA: site-specific DNA-methyltransferase [Candidatus Paceibacterota bacterium]|nr:site-specific DNA-methyltransferase [Candidatus Paceibacterota bacterium]
MKNEVEKSVKTAGNKSGKVEIPRVAMASEDMQSENLAKLRAVFPQFVKEAWKEDENGKHVEQTIDFDALRKFFEDEGMLSGSGSGTGASDEKFGLSWAGKSDAFRAIRTPATGTLTPTEKESKNWNDTENLFLEGDNLEVLKLLQKHYREKIKMVYIDPPYNTGKDFVYKDNFRENVSDYYERTGQSDGGIKMTSNAESNGRYHSDWLTMMYPRLFLAKNLLRQDGVIFVSIDDNEVHNLRAIMNEIFGEENFVAQIVWQRKRGRDNSAKFMSRNHEYILVYARYIDKAAFSRLKLEEVTLKAYRNADNDKRGAYRLLGVWARGTQGGSRFEFITKTGQVFSERLWLMNKDSLTKMDQEDRLVYKKGSEKIYRKLFIDENDGNIPATIWDDTSNAANAADEIKNIFDFQIFDTVKPIPYIKRMVQLATSENDIILDFFAGSGTTAHAVMDLNAEDGGSRRFICVQLPEETAEDSEARKAGYETIAQISRERIRRAGEKIKARYEKMDRYEMKNGDIVRSDISKNKNLDLGFKAFTLLPSNYRRWRELTEEDDEEIFLAQTKLFLEKPLIDRYDEKSVVYEVLLKEGFSLNAKVKKETHGSLDLWHVSDHEDFAEEKVSEMDGESKGKAKKATEAAPTAPRELYVTFAKTLTQDEVDALKLPKDTLFVCLDSALDDTTKVNLVRNLTVKVI